MLLLGKGTTGEVLLVRRGEELRAMKCMKLRSPQGLSVPALREARLLSQLNHKHIVNLHNVKVENGLAKLELEFLPLSLRALMFEPLTMPATRAYGHDIFTALEFCHRQNVMHRDIKPDNILLSRNGHLKLADFGLAREMLLLDEPLQNAAFTPQMVTLWYRAPEILLGHKYGLGVDIWSAACVIAEMLAGAPLFCAPSEIGMLKSINEHEPDSMTADPSSVAPFEDSVQRLLIACLKQPQCRITASDALRTDLLSKKRGRS